MPSSYVDYVKEQARIGNVFPVDIQETSNILRNISSLMYEFKDSTVEIETTENGVKGVYTKKISPLFYDRVINNSSNFNILSIIGDMVPYYYLEPENDVESLDVPLLKETRDLGINDVPSPLQNSDFYETWFRETWGFIQNSLILSTYNKLRYPFINENQYLNINLFSYMSNEAFSYDEDADSESYIGFMDTEEENDEANNPDNEYYGEEIGCLDFIDDIVNQKILGSYSIIDYANKQNVILNKWGESLFASGQLSREEVDTSKTIFKLQDIKNELLRRKFAGSRTIYDLAIGTVNRQGSFVTAIKYYDLPDRTLKKDSYFNNKRMIRVLRLPGLISKPYDYENKLGLDLFKVYLEKDIMPINVMVPLFYTSADILKGNEKYLDFNSERFFSGSSNDPGNIKNYTDTLVGNKLITYQSNFLRDNSNTIDWSSIDGIIISNNVNERYEILDRYLGDEIDPETGEVIIDPDTGKPIPIYRKLDEEYSKYSAEDAGKYIYYVYRDYSTKMRLDIKSRVLDLDLVSGSVADVNADKILYHYNSIQEMVGDDYQYVRYPIAGNNGPCLIDTYWLDYIENEVRSKSKVQDNTEIGTQINTMLDLRSETSDDSLMSGKHYFFGVSFTDKDYGCLIDEGSTSEEASFDNIEIRDYQEGDKYVLLWYCVITYEAESIDFKITNVEKTLISKISLRTRNEDVDAHYREDGKPSGNIMQECEEYVYANIGILPLTYSTAINDKVWEARIGFYGKGDAQKFISDDILRQGYSKSYFLFSDYDITKSCSDINLPPVYSESGRITGYNTEISYCSSSPSKETKTIYYIVNRTSLEQHQRVTTRADGTSTLDYDDNGQAIIESSVLNNYYWSDPIRVIHITDDFLNKLKISKFEPEWDGLGYFYNAYLNFTLNSASPLRHKKVLPSVAFFDFSEKLQIEAARGIENIIYESGKAKYIINPGEYVSLSNLNRSKGMDYVCADGLNEEGTLFPTLWTEDLNLDHVARTIEGMYLTRVCPSLDVPENAVNKNEENHEYSSIFGDNRTKDAFDYSFSKTIVYQGITSIEDDVRVPSNPEEKAALYLISFTPKIYDYEYYYWDDEKKLFKPISLSNTEDRSKLYSDYMGMRGINIESLNYSENRTSGIWWPNFFALKPTQTEYPWYWNSEDFLENPPKGKSLFFNIKIDEACVDNGFVLFSSKASDSTRTLRLEATEDGSFKFTVGDGVCILTSDSVLTKDIRDKNDNIVEKGTISLRNFRIAASFVEVGENTYKSYLIVNNDTYESDEFTYEMKDSSMIYLFSDYSGDENWEGMNWRDYKNNHQDEDWTQDKMFYGTVYDMRLYNRGRSLEEIQLLNMGSFREIFSYSPSNFKLANSVYRDSAVLRVVNVPEGDDSASLPKIDSIRIFDRSIWDSIMVDNCSVTLFENQSISPQYREDFENPVSDTDIYKPVSASLGGLGYVLNNCVEQEMVNGIEIFNGLAEKLSNQSDVLISYQSAAARKNVAFDSGYLTTLITTLIEPENYENDALKSSLLKFYLGNSGNRKYIYQYANPADENPSYPIYIPIQTDSSDDYFSYSADIDFNFKLYSEFDISKWLSKGNNVQLEYNSSLDKAVARLSDISLRDSESNSIILPLIVPTAVDTKLLPGTLYMDRFYARDVVLSNSLSAFLSASAYYNEIQVPVSVQQKVTTYEKMEETAYVITSDYNPQSGKVYLFNSNNRNTEEDIEEDTEDLNKKLMLPSRSKFTGTYYLKNDSYRILYRFNENTYVLTAVDGHTMYLQISTGTYAESLPQGGKTIQVYDEQSESWKELQPDDLYFYDGLTYRYSDNSQISIDQGDNTRLIINPKSMYKSFSPYGETSEGYSLCLYRYEITSDYYTLFSSYNVMTTSDFVSGTEYYEYVIPAGGTEYEYRRASFVIPGDDTVYDTLFDREITYYEDYLTENTYYCKKNGEYVYTNVAHPTLTTFKEWSNSSVSGTWKISSSDSQGYSLDLTLNVNGSISGSGTYGENTIRIDGSYTVDSYLMDDDNECTILGTVSYKYRQTTPDSQYTEISKEATWTILNNTHLTLRFEGTEGNPPVIYTFNAERETGDSSDKTLYLSNTDISSVYYNKWDAVRVMKEGTYYFTCKYPMQILPFTDDAFDSSPEINYTTYYATCRFKVVVKGTPKEFEDKNIIEGYPKKYWTDTIESTLKSSDQRYLGEDNRTFPHRRMNIDLYVMDVYKGNNQSGIAGKMNGNAEDYSYRWNPIASNHPEDFTMEVKTLNKEVLESQITLESDLPFFLEKNYVAPFFIAKYNRADTTQSDPESADDDIIDPIRVSSNTDDEFITSNSESDIDNQMIISGKSYKVLFEYTGKVTEISFTDKYYTEKVIIKNDRDEDIETDYLKLTDDEKVNFARLVNLLDTATLNVSEYMYNTDGQSYQKNSTYVFFYNSGFKTSGSGWEGVSSNPVNDKFSFGNPYSRSSDLNYLLQIRDSSLDTVSSIHRINSRQNLNNSYCFPYMVQQNNSNTTIPAFLPKLGTVVDETGSYKIIDFDELGVIKAHYNDIRGKMVSAINALKTQSCGLFMGMSQFTPNFNGADFISYERINNENYELFGYLASNRSLKVRNGNVYMERRNLYSNNLLSNNAFENKADWILSGVRSYKYVSDNNWGEGKDVFQIVPASSSIVKLKYSTGDLSVKSKYEVAININKSLSSGKVKAQFYSGNETVGNEITLTRNSGTVHTGWYNYSTETTDIIVADSVEFIINCSDTFCITKAVIRKCNTVSQYLGLSNVLNQVTSSSSESKIISLGHSMVVYRNKETGEYFPVQFNNDIMNTVSSNGKKVKRPKSGLSKASEFISNNNLGSYGENSRLIKLYSPWIRRLYYISNGPDFGICEVHGYTIRPNSLGKREVIEVYNNISDILDASECILGKIKDESTDRYELEISKLPVNLDDANRISMFNMNLCVDESNPIVVSSERFSSLFNCLEPSMYRNNKDYSVAVTNVQLLERKPETLSPQSYLKNIVVYELEYLPIIYNERKNHLSLNLLLYRK